MTYITPEMFTFFHDLSENNERDWFQAHKERYESVVREPLLQFIRDFEPHLTAISPHYRAVAKKSGGSLYRIYRDTRFAKNKTPYKTHAGVHFRHEAGKDAHAPGFYLHIEPGAAFIGAGLWRPESKSLLKIRQKIVAEGDRYREIVEDADFLSDFRLGGEKLKRGPKGFDKDHPMIEELKRKDFMALRDLTQAEVLQPDFMSFYVKQCERLAPLVRFLTEAVELPF